MVLEFKPPRRAKTAVGRCRIWESTCGKYRVRESRPDGLPVLYYAQYAYAGEYWDIISQHRSQKAAVAACEKRARKAARRKAVAR